MQTEPNELTQARRAYLKASDQYGRWSEHVRQTGGTEATRQALEDARRRLRLAYAEYLDARETAGAGA